MVRLVVFVQDVNGSAYSPPFFPARYRVAGAPGAASVPVLFRLPPGVPTDLPAVGDVVHLSVGAQAPGFAGEEVTLSRSGSRWMTDTPAATVTTDGDTVVVRVVDGVVRLAPTVYLPPEQLVRSNPRALLCEPGQGWIYYGSYLINPPVNLVRNPIRFTDPKPVSYPYDRLDRVPNEGKGQLIFLEYGLDPLTAGSRGPRFLIGVWAPRVALGPTPQVLLFYTPPTKPDSYPADAYPFLDAYPYSPFLTPASKPVPARTLLQPYPYLAINYLLAGYKIIPQLLAGRRNPIVIFPVQPSMSWGPLATQAGAGRLVREVLRFLSARQLVTARKAPFARFSLESGRASVVPSTGLVEHEPMPVTWALTVAGFSNGFDQVLNLCTPRPLDEKRYDPAVFASPGQVLQDSWREIWDIDGVADNGEGASRHLDTLRTWAKGGRRRVRSYHSSQGMRTAPRALVEPARIASLPRPPYQGVSVEEGTSADQSATWVQFSDASLKGSPYDPHHTIPAIAFGHAAQFPLP